MSGLIARTPVQGTTGKLSTRVQAVYDRILLERAVANQVFDLGAQVKSIPSRSNAKTAFGYRYKNLLPATTILAEYDGSNIKRPNKIVREEVAYSIGHYGDYVTYTDELDLYDFDNITSSFLDLLGDQASLTMDTIRRDTLRGGTNVIFADGAADRTEVANQNKKFTIADFKLATVKLKNQGAKKFTKVISGSTKVGTTPVRSAYMAITAPEVVEDLRDLAKWKNVEDYADYSKAYSMDEVGSWGDIRFIESTNNEGIDVGGVNVFTTLVFGENAYCTTTLRGKKAIETKVKALGSAGSEDPLDKQQEAILLMVA